MENKEISYEIIDFSGETNVQFRTSVDPGSYIPTHWHRAIEIIYMQEGSLDVIVESESFTIYKGDCILVNGNVLHSTKCNCAKYSNSSADSSEFYGKIYSQSRTTYFSLGSIEQKILSKRPNS